MDTTKTSEPMRALCESVLALAWRSPAAPAEPACRWADGFPFNLHIYLALLNSVFDAKNETLVLDEVDELLELIKKTWPTLGLNRATHNACFAWALLHHFVKTGQTEQELLRASLAVLSEVNHDWRRFQRDTVYVRTLSPALASILGWADKKLLDYRFFFAGEGASALMESVLLLALSAAQIIDEDVAGAEPVDFAENRVDYYIRSSLRNAFTRVLDDGADWRSESTGGEKSELLVELAAETEEMGLQERLRFSHVFKRWHPTAAAVAAVTLHNCYGVVLRQHLEGDSTLTPESMRVIQAADRLEKKLAQIAVEDFEDCDDGGKSIVEEIVPFELDAITTSLTRNWIEDKLSCIRDCLQRAKDTETWNAKVKGEQHASSAEEMMKLAREIVDDFVVSPLGFREDMVEYLAEGLGSVLLDYTAFAASCGSRKSYIPVLPPLTRCNQDSAFVKLWKKAAPCKAPLDDGDVRRWPGYADHPRPAASRGTHRLYVRLNTLHYLLAHLHHLDKTLTRRAPARGYREGPLFEPVRSSVQGAVQKVAEVAACRLTFLDSSSVLYEGLYAGDVANARIRPALRRLKQNLAWIGEAVAERAQSIAIRELMKATFEAFLMVLLAGGACRAFQREEQGMIAEDLAGLKKVFAACGEGVVEEEVVEREARVAEGVVALMAQTTEQLVEDLGAAARESACAGMGLAALAGRKLPMPPTTGKWGRSDANTILRVLCHRDDEASNRFLKKTFQMAKRR
ncbi:protein unc-13 homolog [Wolffia australiana]